MRSWIILSFLLLLTTSANAVVIATATDNAVPPPDDPGWAHVGTRTGTDDQGVPVYGLTLIYLGNGWVLTAAHVKEADLLLGGQTYPRVSGSKVRLNNPDGSPADLIVYQVTGNPELPDLPLLEIAHATPAVGTTITTIGRGRNRGTEMTWQDPNGPLREGWFWASSAKMRWGTNVVSSPGIGSATGTESFVADFTKWGDPGFTSEESQVVIGDSGGAAFTKVNGEWQLAGVAHAAGLHAGQPASSSVDGNLSYFADLAAFRSQIIPLVRPQCSDEIDNDGDGKIDFPADEQCLGFEANSELPHHVPTASPAALVALIGLMMASATALLGARAKN